MCFSCFFIIRICVLAVSLYKNERLGIYLISGYKYNRLETDRFNLVKTVELSCQLVA